LITLYTEAILFGVAAYNSMFQQWSVRQEGSQPFFNYLHRICMSLWLSSCVCFSVVTTHILDTSLTHISSFLLTFDLSLSLVKTSKQFLEHIFGVMASYMECGISKILKCSLCQWRNI